MKNINLAIIILCLLAFSKTFANDDLFPVDFRLLINEENELSKYGKSHPCGTYFELHGVKIPFGNELFTVDFAYEVNNKNELANRWAIPLDAVPKAISGNRLTVLIAGTESYLYVWPDGAISGVFEKQNMKNPIQGECPDSPLPGGVSEYYCSTLVDEYSNRRRIIAASPVCT